MRAKFLKVPAARLILHIACEPPAAALVNEQLLAFCAAAASPALGVTWHRTEPPVYADHQSLLTMLHLRQCQGPLSPVATAFRSDSGCCC